jgi:hypothetical protein
VLKPLHPGKNLPVWILNPRLNNLLIAQIVGVFEIVKRNQQAGA